MWIKWGNVTTYSAVELSSCFSKVDLAQDWRDIGMLVGNDCFCIICFLLFPALYLLNCLHLNLQGGSPLLPHCFCGSFHFSILLCSEKPTGWELTCYSESSSTKLWLCMTCKKKSGVISWISSKNILYGNEYQHCYNATLLLFSFARGMLEVTVSLFWQVLQP